MGASRGAVATGADFDTPLTAICLTLSTRFVAIIAQAFQMLQIAERKKLHQNLMNRLKKEPALAKVSRMQKVLLTCSLVLAGYPKPCCELYLEWRLHSCKKPFLALCRPTAPRNQGQRKSSSCSKARTNCSRLKLRNSRSNNS